MQDMLSPSPESKMRSPDRILVLKVIDGKAPVASTGLVDKRLFTGENNLHAVMDTQTTLWTVKYDNGGLPEPLKQQFTSFGSLLKYVSAYFRKRNVEIVEVKD